MALSKDQILEEISKLHSEIKEISERKMERIPTDDSQSSTLIRFLLEERDRTNRIERALASLAEQVRKLAEIDDHGQYSQMPMGGQAEVMVSTLDGRILDFIKGKQNEMICADDLKEFMNYKGRNAACSRLKKLENMGFLYKFQLGHKVYYKYDAGKTTNALIISPPQ